MLKFIDILSKTLENIQFWVGNIIMISLTAVTCIQIIRRFIFNNPISWLQEISLLSLVWLVFLGGGVLLKRNQHISVDILYYKFPPKIKEVVNIFLNLAVIGFSILLIYYGFQLYELQKNIPNGVLEIPRSIYYATPLLIFSFSILIFSLEKFLILIIAFFKTNQEDTIWEQ